MLRIVTALIAALVAGWVVAASSTSAGARSCPACGPLPTTLRVHTLHPTKYYTRYHDRSVYKRVPRIHHVIDVTRVQPIIHIHDVTRIHHRKVYYVKNTYSRETVHERALTYVSSEVRNYYEGGCGCSP